MGKWFFRGQKDMSTRLVELDALLVRRDEIASLLTTGHKIEAIKMYRQDTGASLAEAKAAVERMETPSLAYQTPSSAYWDNQAESAQPEEATYSGLTPNGESWRSEVEQLVRRKRKIEAIKLYRTHTNTGLREAKEAVDRLEQSISPTGFSASDIPDAAFSAFRPGRQAIDPDEEVRRYVLEGQKIKAIKVYREQTGLPLKEAKDEIDRLEQILRNRPE